MSIADETSRIELPTIAGSRRWPHLVIVEGDDLGQVFRLLDPETIIGRARDVDVRLTSDSVSRRHARLTIAGDQVFVEDLGSRNGTYIDMDIVKWRQPLKAGAHLAIGYSTLFRFTHATVRDPAVRKSDFDRASRDPLTLAANTHYFLDRLRGEHAYAVRHHEPLTLVFLRVTEVGAGTNEDVEETPETDAAMRRVAAVIRPTLRAEDLLTRSGGTLVALLRANGRQATEMAVRMRSCVAPAPGAGVPGSPAVLTAAVVPLAASAPAAPETILVTAMQVANAAFANGADRVVLLPALSSETIDESSSSGKP